ncbi:MAG: hypothetical protein A3A08_01790 [Candidatus Nealsonbacteria bacterium RIFCSPLOWO2_01_FULL_41_9]|uniref:Methyltransferase type 11 domain-containing protein n=1 Tax=Candidatus Nealsonbacteria bacterium RIFCSPLOWO2_01_FULL_41_9 TaxID=1801671 RepID=A0A1G2EC68_9BACT|nr:MAG: hypothetical protein A3A08_01790 [Candidatus Nealsonbacteria bacterium RIFCSPLOWO2_01_FULL_41_9]
MIKKIFKLASHPQSEYKKIRPFLRTKFYALKQTIIRHVRQRGDYTRLRSNYSHLDRVKLHFGCGPRVLKGWINIDLAFEPSANYLKYYTDTYYPKAMRGDRNDFYAMNLIKTGLPLPDSSVDLIFHEDFLEHLDQKEQVIFLSETLRVLKPGAVHRVNTPNLLTSMREHSHFEQGADGVYTREWSGSGHKNILTPKQLEEVARMIGYTNIIFNTRNKSISADIPPEYRPGSDRSEAGNIFADLIK